MQAHSLSVIQKNREREADLFDKISKEYGDVIIAAVGILLLVGTIRRWNWTLNMIDRRSSKPRDFPTLMQDFLAITECAQASSVLIIVAGAGMFLLMKL